MDRLRAEKNSMKADITDRKDSIENQTEILESFQNTILGVVATMLSEANAGTANHKEKTLAEIDLSKFAGDLKAEMIDNTPMVGIQNAIKVRQNSPTSTPTRGRRRRRREGDDDDDERETTTTTLIFVAATQRVA